jgi:phospholipid/cholesterol/gamma-HCH transport system permease protein
MFQTRITLIGERVHRALSLLGNWSIFSVQTLTWMVRRLPNRQNFLQVCNDIGVRSVGVILITGLFIGMVLAVQMYNSFSQVGLETRIGSIINISIVKELGPVLAATMLAGRVGSAMAAELATMRITEQIDALSVLGANPIQYLVVPRFLACVILIPLLTVLADFMGVLGGAAVTIGIYQVEAHFYWGHARDFVGTWDIFVGLFKSVFFGASIGLISCHRGFHSRPGAQGVGRAATEAFVASFISILVLDFFLAMFLNSLYMRLWPGGSSSFI